MFKMRFLVSLNTGKNGKNVNSLFCWPVVEDRGKNTGRQEEAEAQGGLSGTVTWGPGGLCYGHPELVQASLDTTFPASCYGGFPALSQDQGVKSATLIFQLPFRIIPWTSIASFEFLSELNSWAIRSPANPFMGKWGRGNGQTLAVTSRLPALGGGVVGEDLASTASTGTSGLEGLQDSEIRVL